MFPAWQARRASVVRQNNDGIAFLFRKNKITFFNGTGSFAGCRDGEYRIDVTGDEPRQFTCTHVIVATGSKPRAWPGVPFDEKRVLSNTGVLAMEAVPESLAIIGAGCGRVGDGLCLAAAWRSRHAFRGAAGASGRRRPANRDGSAETADAAGADDLYRRDSAESGTR